MAGRGGRGKVSYVQQSEPDFIRKFKERVGYKEGPTVDTKRQELDLSDGDDDAEETEDEKPVVVVLKDGDLTAEEAERLHAKENEETDEAPADGKILFRKPVKRNAEDVKKTDETNPKDCDSKKTKKKRSSKEGKKSSLLSFDEEDQDDG